MATQVEMDAATGKWVPTYYGNKFKVSRQAGHGQEDSAEKFTTLEQARGECESRNYDGAFAGDEAQGLADWPGTSE